MMANPEGEAKKLLLSEDDLHVVKMALRSFKDQMVKHGFPYPAWGADRVLAIIEGREIPAKPKHPRGRRPLKVKPLKDIPQWAIDLIKQRKP
jgi:hypothetical protein